MPHKTCRLSAPYLWVLTCVVLTFTQIPMLPHPLTPEAVKILLWVWSAATFYASLHWLSTTWGPCSSRPWDTLACSWDVKLKNNHVDRLGLGHLWPSTVDCLKGPCWMSCARLSSGIPFAFVHESSMAGFSWQGCQGLVMGFFHFMISLKVCSKQWLDMYC